MIINGHPDEKSFCKSLADSYKKGSDSAGANCKLVNLYDLKFNPILNHGYRLITELEPDLMKIQQDILNAEHLVLVYPNWWGTFPMAVFTFLESYDFTGKTIVPFCTHEGSGLGSSERDIKKLCPNAKILSGIAIRGGSVASADNLVLSWLKKQI